MAFGDRRAATARRSHEIVAGKDRGIPGRNSRLGKCFIAKLGHRLRKPIFHYCLV
jgi:hypothetical protein